MMSSSKHLLFLRHAILLVLIASSVAQSPEKTAYSRPIITFVPSMPDVYEIIEGGNVSVTCIVVSGHPKPEVTMTVTGNIKRRVRYDRDNLKMEINNLSWRENGRIVCEAKNGLENFTVQKSVYISVQYLRQPNLIVFPPRAAGLQSGRWASANFQTNTIFVCMVDSKPSATFTWKRNGVQMVSCNKRGVKITEALGALSLSYSPPSKPISTMTLSADLPESNKTGYYECIATTQLNGSAISKQYGLNYTSQTAIPVLKLKTKDKVYVNTGGTIRIICEATSGQPAPEFTWTLQQKNKPPKAIKENGKTTILTQKTPPEGNNVTSMLEIKDVNITHDGTYSCVANNHVDMQFKRKTRVVVRYLKSVKFWLTSFDFAEDKKNGKAVWITCYAETSPETIVKYSWHKKAGASDQFLEIPTSGNNNREIKFLKKKDERNSVVLPARSSRLEIKHLQETDCGYYRCHAEVVGLNITKKSMEIEVNDNLEPPHFLPIDKKLVVRENDNVTLRCNVTGKPQSKVMFYRQHNATMPELYKGEKALWRLVDTNGTLAALTITKVKRKHRGIYFCRSFRVNGFTNKPRTQWKGEISLDVQYPPELKPVYQEIRIATNKEKKLRCNVYGTYPKISSVTWYKNGKKQPQRTRYYKLDVRNNTSDYGTYVCRVANPAGNRTCTFNVSGRAFEPKFFYNTTSLSSGYDDEMLTVRGISAEYFNGPTAQYDYHLFWTQKNPNAVDSVEKYEIKWRALNDDSRQTRQTSEEGPDDGTIDDWAKDTLQVSSGRTDYNSKINQQQRGHLFSLTLKNLSRLNHPLQKYEVIITPINKLGEGDSSRRVVRLQRSPRNVKWDSDDNFFCQFSEPDICGFMQGLSMGKDEKLFNWTRNSNLTVDGRRTSGTGPDADRSNHKIDGGYMYVESSFRKKDFKARLISPVFKPTMKCLKFFYHMKGKSIGRLTVKQRFGLDDEVEIWSKVGEISSTWNVDNISFLRNRNQQFSIVFEAKMTEVVNNWGDIAIDDILVDKKECIDIPTSTPPTTSSSTSRLVSYGRLMSLLLLPLLICIALN